MMNWNSCFPVESVSFSFTMIARSSTSSSKNWQIISLVFLVQTIFVSV